MNILDRFEHSFERLIEGSVGRVFRSPIQPAEIGRKLERAMVSNQVVSVDSTLVPNEFRVAMNPRDMVLFADFVPALCRQLEGWLGELAGERGFTFIDRVRVQIIGNDSVPRRAIQVSTSIAGRPDSARSPREDNVQRTEVFRLVDDIGATAAWRLRFTSGAADGLEHTIRKPVTTVGRALDNDVVLLSSDTSRHHARLELHDENLVVVDLSSTNGTLVNGRSVRSHVLRSGDEVTFGTLKAEVFSSPTGGR